MEATPSSRLSPPAVAAPLEDPVSMLDQPEPHGPEWGSISETKYPTGHRDQKENGEPSPTFGKELPDQEGLTLLDPAPHSPLSRRPPMSYAPTRLPSPEPLPPAVPVTEGN